MTDIPVTQAVPVPVLEPEKPKFDGEWFTRGFNGEAWEEAGFSRKEYAMDEAAEYQHARVFRLPSDDEVAAAKRQRELARTRIRALRNTASTIGHVIRSELVVEELDWLLREVLAEPEVTQ